jgi:hypothetical protein
VAAWAVPSWAAKYGHWPPVGVYIAIMGLAVALMALPKEPKPWEKFLWIIVITALMVAEIRNVYRTDADQAQTFQTILCGLRETNRGLSETANGIKATVQEIQAASLKIDAVGNLAKENLENVTGGKSFAHITPQIWSGSEPIRLSIYNDGEQTLTGVTVVIRTPEAWDFVRNPDGIYQAEASPANIGTLHTRELKILDRTINPVENREYQFDIAAQNFTVVEHLWFRRGTKLPWNFKYVIDRQYVKSQTKKETRFGYETMAKTKDWVGN